MVEQIATHKPKLAIVGQGLMEDDSLNSVACCGVGDDRTVLLRRCGELANEHVKLMRDQEGNESEEDRNAWGWHWVEDGSVVTKNEHSDSAWTVVEIYW